MTSFDDLLSNVPVAQIANKLGVDEATATTAINAAIPVLLGGFQAQAGNPDVGLNLEGEVANQPATLLDGGVDIEQVDTAAGSQIVDQTFGAEKNTVISALGNVGGGNAQDLMAKLLPMLAPIVLAYLGKKALGGGAAAGGGTQAASSGGLGDILGGLLSGATGGNKGGGGLADVLGKAVGQNAGGVLGNVLGGLLGGKK
ncbi:DUF937 domain-containing protein [Nocardia huaxiensis]|uniref:DUF937 domain-containing protein n=1 Tax=Nocardia huaxiensis TaxID=2755382 RepID=A0A7D6VD64_9NOCA|nr:DUF937 domain-containing protein [Nocardia huaxiensis]QLY31622.1 DUF937 domain-containing protein [Nocardia huaxiensis]UFS95176.1 DUF937 domain-containing protein [Nocardia huaxiensis]